MEQRLQPRRTLIVRTLILTCSLLLSCAVSAQTAPASQIQTDLRNALIGDWVGVLEYRDYSEPPTSTKRVDLPTWLSITANGPALSEHFIYDDGPAKTVDSTDTVTLDPAAGLYTETSAGKAAQVYKVTGYDKLKSGRGELVLSGAGTDNDKPAEIRMTLTIRRNLLTWTEETRPAGSSEAFAFRHAYRFTRAKAPTVTSP